MKKFFSLLIAFTLISTASFAQTASATCSAPGIELKFKRCIAQGSNVFVHFTITNYTNKDLMPLVHTDESVVGHVYRAEAFDDEGNHYSPSSRNMIINMSDKIVDGVASTGEYFSFPKEITIKGIITLKNVDEYATIISRITIPFRDLDPMVPTYGIATITLKNIPIPRE